MTPDVNAAPAEPLREEPANVFVDPIARRPIGVSFRNSYARRVMNGFMQKYFSGHAILDIGYRGGDPHAVPITENAIGVELDYPGYDGVRLPFPDESQDTVLAAHVLEHILDYKPVVSDWHRVLKIGGFLVVMVPHRDLYERNHDLPSRWNGDHKRLYTPASLMTEIEASLPVSSYRVRHLVDNDHGFDYARAPHLSPTGCYEIELVLEKIRQPPWWDRLRFPPAAWKAVEQMDQLIVQAARANLARPGEGARMLSAMTPALILKKAVRPLLELVQFDAEAYGNAYADLRRAQAEGKLRDLRIHWLNSGYFEGRIGIRYNPFPAA
jgi:predicted SAM-dependent methyltransferase